MAKIELKPGDLIPTELLCWECTGAGIVHGFAPCKVCKGKGYIEEPDTKDVALHAESIGFFGGKKRR